ncbi:MAG: hypothetical protein R3Y47_04575 [Lachnospiraceae bacterium]
MNMTNLILFFNAMMSYLLVFIVFIIVIGVGITLGIKLRKKKDLELALEQTEKYEEVKEA